MPTIIRVPKQKRSIEKRNKIIEKGFELICKKGFHNTNTAEIAKYAGVSTGIIYNYFKDKKDILMEGINLYFDKIMFPILEILNSEKITLNNIEPLLKRLISILIKQKELTKVANEELKSLSYSDKDINKLFLNRKEMLANRIVKILEFNDFKIDNILEKVYLIIGLVENLCNEIIYNNYQNLNTEVMTNEAINIILSLVYEDEDLL